MSSAEKPHRRFFLKQVASIVGATPLSLGAGVAIAAPETAPQSAEHSWRFFSGTEARAAEAAVARLIPADDIGPGAREAGVAVFIDLQLASAWGIGDHFYGHGPFLAGAPQQGYQLAFTPAQTFRLGLAGLDRASRKAQGAAFADLAPAQQDSLLAQAEGGKLD